MIRQFESLLQTVVLHPDMRLSELQRMLDEADKQQKLAVETELEQAAFKKLRNARRKTVSGSQLKGGASNGTRSNDTSVVLPKSQDRDVVDSKAIASQAPEERLSLPQTYHAKDHGKSAELTRFSSPGAILEKH
jgi:hypothetical protein